VTGGAGRAGEGVDLASPVTWERIEDLGCTCGARIYAPRGLQGAVGHYGVCADEDHRMVWSLSVVGPDIVGVSDGVLPMGLHHALTI
jgi:hypothetical protein